MGGRAKLALRKQRRAADARRKRVQQNLVSAAVLPFVLSAAAMLLHHKRWFPGWVHTVGAILLVPTGTATLLTLVRLA